MLGICSVLFKQKTAYEMRMSDWSSDVCSSDLVDRRRDLGAQRRAVLEPRKELGGAKIGEEAEFGAQAEDRLFGAQMPLDRIEARVADGAEQDRVGGFRSEERRLG